MTRLLLSLLAAAFLVAGCKTQSGPAAPQGLGRKIADGPAREVITAPGGGAIGWLADPTQPRDMGARISDQVWVGKAQVAIATGGPTVTLGGGVATLPGTFFFSPDGRWVGALTDWSFRDARGTLVVAEVSSGKVREVAKEVTFFVFSPDGERLAFVADRTLHLEPTAGGERAEVISQVSTAQFSRSGDHLAVRRRAVGGRGELLLVNADQIDQRQELARRVAEYRWAPQGEEIVFTARNETGGTDLFVTEADQAPRRVGTGVTTFAFSPTGDHLAFIGGVSPQKQFGDLFLLVQGAREAVKIGDTVTTFEFSPDGRRIAWLDRYSAQSRGGNLAWSEVSATPEAHEIRKGVPSFAWAPDGDALAFIYRQTVPIFSLDLHLFRIGKDETSVEVRRGVFGYSFDRVGDRLFFRTECTRNARSCDLHTIEVAEPTGMATRIATGIFTYEADPDDQSMLMLTYARTDAEALDVALVPADGSKAPRTIDRMVAHGTKFVGGDGDRITYAVLDPARAGVYVADPPDFGQAD